VGALGQALADADVDRAVVANGDRGRGVRDGLTDEGYGREAALALADPGGGVPGGRVGAGPAWWPHGAAWPPALPPSRPGPAWSASAFS